MANIPAGGELDHRVAFDKRIDANDGYGNTVASWLEQSKAWAAFRSRGGNETVIAARLEGRSILGVYVPSSVKTRAVTPDWRMRDVRLGTEYAIIYVDAVTDPAWVYLDVQKGVAP